MKLKMTALGAAVGFLVAAVFGKKRRDVGTTTTTDSTIRVTSVSHLDAKITGSDTWKRKSKSDSVWYAGIPAGKVIISSNVSKVTEFQPGAKEWKLTLGCHGESIEVVSNELRIDANAAANYKWKQQDSRWMQHSEDHDGFKELTLEFRNLDLKFSFPLPQCSKSPCVEICIGNQCQ